MRRPTRRTGTARRTSCHYWKNDTETKTPPAGGVFHCGSRRSATAQSLLQDGHHARGGIGITLRADHAAVARRRDAAGDRTLHGFALAVVEHAMEEAAFRLPGDDGVHGDLVGMGG